MATHAVKGVEWGEVREAVQESRAYRIIVVSLVYLALFLMYEAVKYAALLSWSNGGGPLI